MNSLNNRRNLINRRKQELTKKYGSSPILYSSGRGINSDKEYPQNMKINLDSKVIKECFIEPK